MKTLIALSLLLAQAAWAEPPTGTFKGRMLDQKVNTFVYIKTVQSDPAQALSATTYGLVVAGNGSSSLYRVEQIDRDSQAWIQIYQKPGYVLGVPDTQDATFSVKSYPGKGNRTALRFTPTEYGRRLKCLGEFVVEQDNDRSNQWIDLPDRTVTLKGAGGKVQVRPGSFSGPFAVSIPDLTPLQSESLGGDFKLTPLFQGLEIMRAQQPSPEAPTGRALSREITAVAAVLGKPDRITLEIIQLKRNQVTCGYPRSGLVQE